MTASPTGTPHLRRLRAARRAAQTLRRLSSLTPDQRDALVALARTVADEWVAPARSAHVDPGAIISPLATLRFAERIAIGPRANIGPFCCVWGGWSRTWARVGAGALLSPGVVLVAGNHRLDEPGWVRDTGFEELDVEIGEGAWIGAHAVVVGCRVGDRAVVGAGSVVLEDVPDDAIAVGVPARVVASRPNPA